MWIKVNVCKSEQDLKSVYNYLHLVCFSQNAIVWLDKNYFYNVNGHRLRLLDDKMKHENIFCDLHKKTRQTLDFLFSCGTIQHKLIMIKYSFIKMFSASIIGQEQLNM